MSLNSNRTSSILIVDEYVVEEKDRKPLPGGRTPMMKRNTSENCLPPIRANSRSIAKNCEEAVNATPT